MRLHLSRILLIALSLALVAGCSTVTPTPTPAPTAVVEAPTQTPYPTATFYPTHTPYPTQTPRPTSTPQPTATAIATPTETPTPTPTMTPRPFVAQPVGSAALWRTPGEYPIAPQCVTYGSSFDRRDWQETFCIIKVEVYRDPTHDAIRFYGHWQVKLVRGTPRGGGSYHPYSRGVTYVVDNLGNQYIPARYGGAADADVLVYGNDYLLGYMDNDNPDFPHEPSAWWEFVPARPGVSSFTFVNSRYSFRIGPIVLSR